MLRVENFDAFIVFELQTPACGTVKVAVRARSGEWSNSETIRSDAGRLCV